MSGITASITATVVLPGWHSWPAATGRRAYLASLHRHLFHITAAVPVAHDDRDVEFHDLADQIRAWWGDPADQRDRGSCEAMARDLYGFLLRRPLSVSVGEDGEAWATITREDP